MPQGRAAALQRERGAPGYPVGLFRIPRNLRLLAAAALAATSIGSAQLTDLKTIYDPQNGLIALQPESGEDVEIVTTDTVPGKACKSVEAQFPVMAQPAGAALRNIADAAIRSTRAIRKVAVAVGANAVLGLRTSTFVTCNGNPRLLMYGTLPRSE